MREYKMLKDGVVETCGIEQKLAIGEVYNEWLVDSLCSVDFNKEVNCTKEGGCIDCLVKFGVVELVVE